MILLIDAGHGGLDPQGNYTTPELTGKKHNYGTVGYHGKGWFYEGVSNRRLASEFIAQASRQGFQCVPVYHSYNDTSLSTRTTLANHIASTLKEEAIYISFHSNAFNGEARGFRIYHHPNSHAGRNIATDIAQYVAPLCEEFGSPSPNPVKTANFHVLQYTAMPAVLLENLFFDHPEDADLLMDATYCVNLCNRILQGIKKATTK